MGACVLRSPGIEACDRGEKLQHYQRIASLRYIVLVAQNERLIEVWRRHGGGWARSAARSGQSLVFEDLGCRLSVYEIYERAGA